MGRGHTTVRVVVRDVSQSVSQVTESGSCRGPDQSRGRKSHLEQPAARDEVRDARVRHARAARDVERRQAAVQPRRHHRHAAVGDAAPAEVEAAQPAAAAAPQQRRDAAVGQVAAAHQLERL